MMGYIPAESKVIIEHLNMALRPGLHAITHRNTPREKKIAEEQLRVKAK